MENIKAKLVQNVMEKVIFGKYSNMEIIIMRGLPASGKTTWTKNFIKENWKTHKVVSRDYIRELLHDGVENWEWDEKFERLVKKIEDLIIISTLWEGYNIIVDDTNLKESDIEHITEQARLVYPNIDVRIVDLRDVPLEVCIERDKNREGTLGEELLRKIYRERIENSGRPEESTN